MLTFVRLRTRSLAAVGSLAVAAGLLALPSSTSAAAATPAARPLPRSGSAAQARHNLAVARSLFASLPTARTAQTPMARPDRATADPTLALIALRRTMRALSPAGRAEARTLLARPTDGDNPGAWTPAEVAAGAAECDSHVCVHWTPVGRNAPPAKDKLDEDGRPVPGGNGVPDQVDQSLAQLGQVWTEEVVNLGYRAPKQDNRGEPYLSDADRTKFDVYLSDVGARGYYGYCAPDQNHRRSTAFCVLDNDFTHAQFPSPRTPLQDLQVTAAHEFFHAIQFNYDLFEDLWFMEATAAWMEDVVYPAVNDNLQYLSNSPLRRRYQPLDYSRSLARYGSWIFIRYLTDRFGVDLTRRAWTNAIGRPYSLQALAKALPRGPASFGAVFADFTAANTAPRDFYGEGGRYQRFVARPDAIRRLGAGTPTTGRLRANKRQHLSATTLKLVPRQSTRRLAIRVLTPPAAGSPGVRLVITRDNGTSVLKSVPIRNRVARAVIGFSRTKVASVSVVLTNGSRRFVCRRGTQWSCSGQPRDNHETFRVRASLVG